MEIAPGKSYKAYVFANGNVYKCHVCAIIDKIMIVYKYYGKHKQWWHYSVTHKMGFKLMIEKAVEFNKQVEEVCQ